MNVAFHIPTWILWTVGWIALAGLIYLAAVGVVLLRSAAEACRALRNLF